MRRGQLAAEADFGWTRVSSSKPYVAALILTAITALILLVVFREQGAAFPLVAAGAAIATGLIVLNWKVVHRRGDDYRISTLFYSEVVCVDDVCMTVKNPGPFWTRLRIHLRRPARFGWRISFVPSEKCFNATAGSTVHQR